MRESVEHIRKQYPVGCRVELLHMDDPQAPPIGTKGTVKYVDDIGNIGVAWDNGSSLNIIYGIDVFRKCEDDIRIINLTPHSITFVDASGNKIMTVEPSGQVARCTVNRVQVDTIAGIPVNKSRFGKVENLPEPQEGTIYIVSALTAQAVPDRKDVYITDDAVRDGQGRIIGCRALSQI